MTLLSKLRSIFRAFRRDESGASAIEFVIVMPILLVVFVPGSWEATNALLAKRKASQVATVLADLTTQMTTINQGQWDQLSGLVRPMMRPYDNFPTRLRVIGIQIDSRRRLNVRWDYGTAPLDVGAFPAGMIVPNTFYVMAAAEVDYQPVFTGDAFGDITFRDTAILSPRHSFTILNN